MASQPFARRLASHAIYKLDREVIDESGKRLQDWDKDYTAYFLSTSQAMLLQKWISDNYPLTPSELGEWYTRLTRNMLQQLES